MTAWLYEPNGISMKITNPIKRIDDGLWYHCGLVYDETSNAGLDLSDENGNWIDAGEWFAVPAAAYTNDCNLIIGKNNLTGYKWEIDNIRSYSGGGILSILNVTQNRFVAGNADGLIPVAVVRFNCDYADPNNTATRIYDDKSVQHLIGTFNDANHVKYEPFFWHWYDSAAMQHRMGGN